MILREKENLRNTELLHSKRVSFLRGICEEMEIMTKLSLLMKWQAPRLSKAAVALPFPGFSLRILVAGETRCNVTVEYFERGSTSK